jgi:perosamine synthetase
LISKQHWRFNGNETKYISQVLENGFKASADGLFSTRFEKYFANIHNLNFSIAVNSGTSALHAALLALDVRRGDEVLTPALTPFMCGLAPYYVGAIPVYVDSNPRTFLMDPADLESKITNKTKVIIVVHMYGGVCELNRIKTIADKYNLKIIEDCSQCFLGVDDLGNLTGTVGDINCWSLENSKQISTGDGGIAAMNSEALAQKFRKIAGLGFKTLRANSGEIRTQKDLLQNPEWERFDSIGFNFRMNQLTAAVALAQSERLQYFVEERIKIANQFDNLLSSSNLLRPQFRPDGFKYTYFTYSSVFNGEDHDISWMAFRKKFIEFGGDGYYSAAKVLPDEPIFKELKIGYGEVPVARKLQQNLMNFTTNQSSDDEREIQLEALNKTLNFFGDS